MRRYASQWKTFVGLAPEAFVKLVLLRRETLRECPPPIHDYRKPPHARPLFYERRFRVLFEDFATATDSFIGNYIDKSLNVSKRG